MTKSLYISCFNTLTEPEWYMIPDFPSPASRLMSAFLHSTIPALTILSVFITFNTMPLHAQTPDFQNAWQETAETFEQTLVDHSVVGGALLFLEAGDIKAGKYYGMADINEGREVTRETIFHWASITKTFTAVAVMQLRDRGLLDLDDPLTSYLPELREIHNPFGSMDEITIRMALNHSTGLRNPTWPWGGNEDWHPFEPTEWGQLAAMFPYSEIEFEPGSRHSYSNPAIIFLGKIIEELSGDPYEVYIDKNILKPLEMYHTYFNRTPPHLLPYRSNSYTLQNGKPVPRGLDFHTGITTSNGGLNAPLTDMVKYLNFLLGTRNLPFEILERPSLEELWQEQLPIEETEGIRSSAALSFFIQTFADMRVIGHTGTQHSFYSFFYIHPESGTAVISVTNTDGEKDMFAYRREMSRVIFEKLFVIYKQAS